MGCAAGCLGIFLVILGFLLLVGELAGLGFAILWGVLGTAFGIIGRILRIIFR